MSSTAAEGPVQLLGYDREALRAFFSSLGERPFRAAQLLKWVHQRRVRDFAAMTDLGKALRERLAEQATLALPEVLFERAAGDGTRKWLLGLADGNAIETVHIPDGQRGTLCVSSQVGCALDCSFCATAEAGFHRNLTAAEIVAQVQIAEERLAGQPGPGVTNVVFMGMGEPLLNLDAVLAAVSLLLDDDAYGLSKRRVTISTSGVVPALYRMAERTDVSLAVSLHAADNALRDELVPLNRKHPLERLLPACSHYMAGKPHRRVTFEYVMLDGVNDAEDQADALVERLAGIPSKVNLIPFNPYPGAIYRRSPPARVRRFAERLLDAGLTATIRATRGEDIDGACGQLVGKVRPRERRPARGLPA